ncbi:acyltransferase [Rhodoferax sp.]|uniref:acyltransferase n=1 Tax=Rhodoferax sp. TaxID=50421 RepID=UPI002730D4D0|nr:acyltransferase [Rhodoferax sp.]MDP2440558.1 acyltransferase [Rhodoferax sp.]MDZ4208665.1 acyltransferase [Rhodoferax sp.]
MNDPVKEELLQLLKVIWKSEDFKLSGTVRSRGLRLELLTRALSAVMTDDERAQLNGLPAGCRMRENAKILAPDRLVCGNYVWIGEGVIVDASGGLEIGDHTTLGSGSYIWSHSSVMANILMDNRSGNPYIVRSRTRIGRGTFIGGPSVVYPGVSIGDRCIVMPMSVVASDVPDNTMVGGSPARVIKQIDDAYIDRFKATLAPQSDRQGQP